MADAEWLPRLITWNETGGNWNKNLEVAYQTFKRDFLDSQPQFRGKWVRTIREPLEAGKEPSFWHCISEGKSEPDRKPQLSRIERIAWIRAVIEHSNDELIDVWENMRGTEHCCCIWFGEEFLVVLAERTRMKDGFKYWILKTAYDTPDEHRKVDLRAERDAAATKND